MPIPVVRLPPPALERSLVPYTVTMFNRICDAMLKAFGGDFQSGIAVANFSAASAVTITPTFPQAFSQVDGPLAFATPIDNAIGVTCEVTRSTNVQLIIVVTSTGGPITASYNIRWVAWYP